MLDFTDLDPYTAGLGSWGISVEFTHNHFSKIYWILGLVLAASVVGTPDTATGKFVASAPFFLLLFFGLKAMSHRVSIHGRRLTSKTLFGEQSIDILPQSRIYIRRNMQSYNLILRHYDYRIDVVNPGQTLKINANVNDADQLFEAVAQLERRYISPDWLDQWQRNRRLQLDDRWLLTPTGIQYGKKTFFFDKINAIDVNHGYFRILADGKLWQTALLSVPVSELPNIHTFMHLLSLAQNP